jgi:hypothetical protein
MSFITKTDLSLGPQLGSQMGQYASLFSLSKKTKHNIVLFKELFNLHRGIKIVDPFNLSCDIHSYNELNQPFEVYQIKNVLFDDDVYNIDVNKNWDLRGLFHTYVYWDEYRKELLKEFEFKSSILEKSKKYISSIPGTKVSMHFRRTDYLQVSSLNLTQKYYADAFSALNEKVSDFTTIVFSDDIEWCKENVIGENIVYSENHSNYEDMCIMSLCDHNIIANSTFSWWGAYLNQNPDKIVICPYDYVGTDTENFINGNYFPKDWISIKV